MNLTNGSLALHPMTVPRSPLVLLAEDDDAMRELLSERLSQEGMRVVEVEDGFELRDYLELCLEGRDLPEPDIVITDVRMPGETGLDALIHTQPLRAPVVLISAFAGPEVYATATKLKVAAILPKPFELDTLVNVVNKALRDHPGPNSNRGGQPS